MIDRREFLHGAGAAGGLLAAAGAAARPASRPAARPARDAIEDLADYMLDTRFADLPDAVLAVTRRQLADTVAVGIAGRHEDGVRQLRDLAAETGGRGESVLWGSGLRVPAQDAARVNAAMAHALEFDDTFGRGFLHPAVITFPAALAVADMAGGIDGREFLAAATLAIDAACRIALSSQPGVDGFATGWHNTSLVGYLTTAMLAARLMRLDRARMIDAAGIAYHQAAGNAQSHIDGALTKRLGPGLASAAGVFAARLAARGVSGPHAVLEGEKGWYRQYHRGNYSRELLLGGLGSRFPAMETAFKPWPSCRGSHTSADAALRLVADHGLRPGQIDRILIRNGPAEWPFLSNPIDRKRRPASVVEAQFSIPWVVAAAFVDGKVRLAQFTPDALRRDDILAMAQRIVTEQDDGLAGAGGGPGQAEIAVTTRDGRVLRQRVAEAKGDPGAPMTAAETAAKFADCADYAGIGPDRAGALRGLLERIDTLDDISRLTAAMAVPD
ncbi:MmgE/PrpD family protein [Sphingomonas canadensis]|uniref:MmgE/PrpD family protein n=1 Tax=Sphingomonas canadensis TaxID=1219257 RepID=A0ABW3H9F8_9SPHN|nr:MmgE/PrpD family protein [Sphingomonas canadensis]MCW3837010.1 MmgE/PrpD family protein [Sphingomonas canadensis]